MKRGQKRKTQNLVMVTAALSMFATGITPSLEILCGRTSTATESV